MKMSTTYTLPFRRKLEGKTDYKKRMRLLSSRRPRLVVRRSLNSIIAQIVVFGDNGDRTLVSANSQSLKKLGWTFACDNTPAAYLTGFAIGKAAVRGKVDGAILDSGLYRSTKGNRVYAVVKGAIDAGLKIPADESMMPSEDRLSGKHIAKFKDLPEKFEQIKQTLSKGA